jgi:hypothetical protein
MSSPYAGSWYVVVPSKSNYPKPDKSRGLPMADTRQIKAKAKRKAKATPSLISNEQAIALLRAHSEREQRYAREQALAERQAQFRDQQLAWEKENGYTNLYV